MPLSSWRSIRRLILINLLLAGCATSPRDHFQTVADPSYSEKLSRVLLVPHEETFTHLGSDFDNRALTLLQELLGQAGVATEVARPATGGLDENAPIEAAAARFRPKQELIFFVKRFDARQYYSWLDETQVIIEFKLWDFQAGKVVWRSEARYMHAPLSKEVVEGLVDELRASRLL